MTRGVGFALLAGFALAAACAGMPHPAILAERTHSVQVLLDTGRLAEAETQLDQILRDAPSYAPAHVQAARLVIMNGHLVAFEFSGGTVERAEQILLKARELDPKYAETHSVLGYVYILGGKYPEAEASLTEADRLGSKNLWTKVNWGHLYSMQGKWTEAQTKWTDVFNGPHGDTAQDRRAVMAAIEFQRNFDARIGDVEGVNALCDLAPQTVQSLGNCANDLSIAGDFDAAIAKARGVLARADNYTARYAMACGLIGKWGELSAAGKKVEAEKYFAEAAEVYPRLEELTENFCGGSPKHVEIQQRLRKRLESP